MGISLTAIKTGVKGAITVCSKHSHAVAAGLSVVTMGFAVYKAVKCTEVVNERLQEAEIKKNEKLLGQHNASSEDHTDDNVTILDADGNEYAPKKEEAKFEPLTKQEKMVIYAKTYWPVAALMLVSAGLSISSVILAEKQIKKMTLLATAAEAALDKYESAANKVLGEEKAAEIKTQIAKDQALERITMLEDESLIPATPYGDTLFFDSVTGQLFKSTVSEVQDAINELNSRLAAREDSISVQEYLDELIPAGAYFPASVSAYQNLGWSSDSDYYRDNRIHMAPIEWITHPADSNKAIAIIVITNGPRPLN